MSVHETPAMSADHEPPARCWYGQPCADTRYCKHPESAEPGGCRPPAFQPSADPLAILRCAAEALADEWDACDEHGNPLQEGSLSEAADDLRELLRLTADREQATTTTEETSA